MEMDKKKTEKYKFETEKSENRQVKTEKPEKYRFIKGLELSRRYYEEVGRPAIKKAVPEVTGRLAAGLVGQGSECFGFDDALSTDHDYGPAFCIWLTDEDYALYGERLQQCYDGLPGSFAGVSVRQISAQGQGRVGVFSISRFYKSLIGRSSVPERPQDWYLLSESGLATAVNGAVFEDGAGEFTKIREGLLAYYPKEVWQNKLAQSAALAAQAGQYNYGRLMRRGEWAGAAMAEKIFMEQAMQLAYLLNRKYAPFYKWMHRGMEAFETLKELPALFTQLALLPAQTNAWEPGQENIRYGLNLADAKVVCMETICGQLVQEFHRQGLSDVQDNYLEAHIQSFFRS